MQHNPNNETERFIFKKYRSQWGYLPFVLFPFLGLILVILLLKVFEVNLSPQVSMAFLTLLGLGYAVYIFTLPNRVKKEGLVACQRALAFTGQDIVLLDTKRNMIIAKANLNSSIAFPGKFHYSVTSRFAHGKYRAPVIILQFEGNYRISIGVQGCSLEWGDNVPLIAKPDYMLSAEKWLALVSILGLNNQLIEAEHTKVG